MLVFTIFSIKKKWTGILFFIAIIAFLTPIYSLYQTGINTDWRFLGDGYWTRVIFLIILDIPSLAILGVIGYNFSTTINENNKKLHPWFSDSIIILFVMRLAFHFILSDDFVYSLMRKFFE